jgi:hypothetical protein
MGAACSDPALPPAPPTLVVRPERVVLVEGQMVALTAELSGAPAGTTVRWLSEASTKFVLDTTTTGPHRVIGRGGRVRGEVRIGVLTSYALVRVEAVVLGGLASP